MPTSYPGNISAILGVIMEINPASVYDIGVGYGKFGPLLREYLDDYNGLVRIDGCEVFAPYIEKSVGWMAYDRLDHGDWLVVEPWCQHYDLVLMVDVLEHFPLEKAITALHKALDMSECILISTPVGYVQDEMYGNPYEAHRSEWSVGSFEAAGFEFVDKCSDDRSVIGVIQHER
jgi:SAM-dependent methyltransferase